METSVSSLREMNERMNAWMAEKPQQADFGLELRMQTGDLVIFQFVANGDEGDRFIKVYRSHIIERQGRDGGKYNEARYCPAQSGEPGVECPLCAQGITQNIKERMSMWLYVQNILHKQLPKDKQFPLVNYDNQNYFNEEVNEFKIWHTSAWRESPWTDILRNAEIYKGLHNFTANLMCVGEKLARRYKFYALPNSPMFEPELYSRAQTECQPILDILHGQLSGPVQVAPQTAPDAPTISIGRPQPFAAPGSQIPTLSVPALQIESKPTEETTPTIQTIQQSPEEEKRPLQKLF